MKDWIIFLFIHVIVPVIGITVYTMLVRRMKQDQTTNPPIIQLFWIFGTYGVAIILILTSLIWKWSGMASIGAFASVTVGLIITVITAFSVFKKMNQSKYHNLTFWLSISYIGFVILIVSSSIIYNGLR